jgi:hybrid cluster-associated redox disulfide protein
MVRAASPMADTLIDDLIDQFPEVIAAFVQRRMHCVGCPMARFETVAEVCEIYQLPLDSFLADLVNRTTDCRSDAEF